MSNSCSICKQLPDGVLCGYCGGVSGVSLRPTGEPTHEGVRVSMSMIVGSVEVNEETGEKVVNRFVSFTTENGHHILYPWEGLKSTVLQWMRIEQGG